MLGLAGAIAIAGGAAASGSPSPQSPPVQRAQLVAEVESADIRSGDDDLRGEDRPPAISPAVPLEAGRNRLTADSPWSALWGPEIEPLAAYDPQWRCISGARPAVAAFAQLLEQAYPQGSDLGISRSCQAGARSEHKEGRAYDWGLRVTSPDERMAAEELLAWLLATDEHGNEFAMARRLGVMYVIWDGHIWSASAGHDGWRVYQGPSSHADHVHLSFSWDGAMGATSFWDAARMGPWLFGPVSTDRLPSSFDLGRDRYRSELGDSPGSLQLRGTPPEPAGEDVAAPVVDDTSPASESTAPAPAPAPASLPAPAPAPATGVSPTPASAPAGGLVEPVVEALLPTITPVNPAAAPTTTIAIGDRLGDAVDEFADDIDAARDALVGG